MHGFVVLAYVISFVKSCAPHNSGKIYVIGNGCKAPLRFNNVAIYLRC
ncbi:hypothetical protein PCARR_b0066 [Pseudoalteromonas carrageenovora IAM 12662]|uniref:Uncharacterized protein n=1 Tax=Pseudoalteromonas carrageenovora IAM 12662 TaxID=1314868 RepID=A0ABR9EUN6_PSEVC|nr:hypothetical protein [Pseudoalteromonas carrageenovora IAM 12662]